MTPINITNWFNENYTYKERMKLRKKYIPRPESYQDTLYLVECRFCDGTGECYNCSGDGNFEHICSCELCDIIEEECEDCLGSGECYSCDGSGFENLD